MLSLICLIVALVLFAVAFFSARLGETVVKYNLIAGGLAFWVLSELVTRGLK